MRILAQDLQFVKEQKINIQSDAKFLCLQMLDNLLYLHYQCDPGMVGHWVTIRMYETEEELTEGFLHKYIGTVQTTVDFYDSSKFEGGKVTRVYHFFSVKKIEK